MKDCQRPKHPPDALGAVKISFVVDNDDASTAMTAARVHDDDDNVDGD